MDFVNVGYNVSSVCSVNQYEILQQTEKLPSYAFWFSLGILFLFLFWFFIQPRFKFLEDFLGLETLRLACGLSIFNTLILLYTSFSFDESTFHSIENVLYMVLGVLGVFFAYKLYKWYKKNEEVIRNT